MNDMLLRNVMLRTVRDARRGLLGYSVGLVLLILMMGLVWPTIASQGDEFQKLLESYPPAMQAFVGDMAEFTTPAGYLRGELYSAMLPLIILLFAIGRSADALAGEEERGALDTLLAHPVSRRRAYMEKAAGVATGITLIALVIALSVIGIDFIFSMGLRVAGIFGASLMLALLAFAAQGVTFALAGWRGRKGFVIALASVFAVSSWLLSSLGRLVDQLEPARVLSVFAHYGDANPLSEGLDWGSALVLLVVASGSLILGSWLFERRDVGVA
jgi:ABC-2 type transport system permease protein